MRYLSKLSQLTIIILALVQLFLPQLKEHLLARILGGRDHPQFNKDEVMRIQFHQGHLYRHRTLRVNYTTYDVLREQDVLNPSTSHCFVLLRAEQEQDSDPHPFIYAKVLGVYHVKVIYGALPVRMDFVHIRWLYYDYDRPGGWDSSQLDRVAYLECRTDQDIMDAFDFIDPKDIIRATHLIPDFCSGISPDFLRSSHSVAHDNADNSDWRAYYVNRFVDRDMLMRYVGGGVGHFKQDIGQTAVAVDHDTTDNDEEVEADDDESDGSQEENEGTADNPMVVSNDTDEEGTDSDSEGGGIGQAHESESDSEYGSLEDDNEHGEDMYEY